MNLVPNHPPLATNSNSRLFAAGERFGGIIKTYVGAGNSLVNACGFGRIAAKEPALMIAGVYEQEERV